MWIRMWSKCSLTLASLSLVGQSAGTILKTLLVFCALKKGNAESEKKKKLYKKKKKIYE